VQHEVQHPDNAAVGTTPFIDALPPPPFRPTLPALLRWAAQQWGANELLVADGERLSFQALETRSARLACVLLRQGAGKGTRIGLWMGNSPAWLVGFFGITRIGAVAVPLSTFLQPPELRWVIGHADLALLLMADRVLHHDQRDRLEAALPELRFQQPPLVLPDAPYLRHIFVHGTGDRAWASAMGPMQEAAASPSADAAWLAAVEDAVTPADAAFLMYTSGSTSLPKGVLHLHGRLLRHTGGLAQVSWPFGAGDRVASTRPFFWIAGLAPLLMYALHRGACVVASAQLTHQALPQLVRNERLTGVVAREAWLRECVEAPDAALALLPFKLVPLAYCVAGVAHRAGDGTWAFVNPDLEARRPAAEGATSDEQAHRALGMTEMLGPYTNERALHRLRPGQANSSGRAVPGVDLLLRDPATGERRHQGEGELLVRGAAAMHGLYKRERADTFTPDGYYPTGDLARIDADGHVFFLRRLGDMIKVRSANVAPAEVEAVLSRQPGVAEAAVFLLDPDGNPRLAAAVVPVPGPAPDPAQWHGALREALSSFKVPGCWFVTCAVELPRTGTGKVQRSALAEWAAGRPAWQAAVTDAAHRPHP
jgi:acyl-CoA synthetase (AMP-forming)/AMP-acid ligase II